MPPQRRRLPAPPPASHPAGEPAALPPPAARFRDIAWYAIPRPESQIPRVQSAALPTPYFPDAPARLATADRDSPTVAAAPRVAATTASDTARPFPDS